MGMLHGHFEVVDALPAHEGHAVVAKMAFPGEQGPQQQAPLPAPPPAPPPARTYTIAPGDTLARIAAARLGDASRWRDIAAANPGLDPRRLRPGRTIDLPAP